MKTFIFLFCTLSFAFNTKKGFSQDADILINNSKTISIKKIFKLINKQTDYKFVYRHDLIKNTPKLYLKKGVIKASTLLNKCLTPNNFSYTFTNNKTIIVKRNNAPVIEKIKEKVQFQISGLVTDNSGEALPGASILEKGTNNGTSTDFDGKYTLNVSDENAILVVSFIGYTAKEVPVQGKKVVNIKLQEDASKLDEIVVVGYGSQRKSDLTGSVSSISSSELTEIPLTRADQLIQGRAAGVSITSTDGSPGGNVKIRIRGANSINGDNEPLVVIDGFLGGSLNNLNPSDIKSIEVLKDASSTAVYGSRGANGVILVTTKSGKKGKTKVEFSSFITSHTLRNKLDLLSAEDHAIIFNERTIALGGSAQFTAADIANFKANGGTDWQDQIFRTSLQKNYNVAVSGGGENGTYLFSMNHVDQEGILINSGYKRYQLRTNINSNINDNIKVGLRLFGIREQINPQAFNSSFGSPVTDAMHFPATFQSVYDSDGNFIQSSDPQLWNPVASALSLTNDRTVNTFNANAFVEFKFTDNLKLRLSGGASYLAENRYQYRSTDNRNAFAAGGVASIFNRESIGWINTNNLTYTKDVNDTDNLTVTLVYEQQELGPVKSNGFNAQNFINQSLGYYGVDLAETVQNQLVSPLQKRSIQSFLGRVNYSLKDKFLFTVSGRYDGSSVLSAGNRWAFFPSAAVAWKLKEESFLKDVDVLSDLKFRVSYGEVGSQGVAVNSSKTTLNVGQNYSFNGSSVAVGVGVGNIGDPNLRWEKTKQYDIGIDASFLDNRLTIAADYYYKNTNDLLLRVSIPFVSGLPTGNAPPTVLKNLGELENSGFELSIGGKPIDSDDFKWDLNLNLATNNSKVLDLGGEDQILGGVFGGSSLPPLFVIEKGQPLGNIRGLIYDGVWKSNEAAEAAAFGNVPGDSKYRDIAGNPDGSPDGKIDDADRTTIGNGTPTLTWGLSSNFTYKNFDLNLFFNGAHGYEIYNFTRNSTVNFINSPELLNRWTPSNENTNVPAFSATDIRRENTSRYVEDGSFIRLKSLVIGYNFTESVLQKINLSQLRIYAGAQNLWTLTDYTGFDPEVNSAGNSDTNNGLDLGGYPPSRSFTLGINITF